MTNFADAFQKTIFDALTQANVADGRIYDEPGAAAQKPYLSFGPSDETEDDADCVEAVEITQQLDVWSVAQDGFREAKEIAAAVRKALHRRDLPMDGASLVLLEVRNIRTFVEADATTKHAAIEVRALIDA